MKIILLIGLILSLPTKSAIQTFVPKEDLPVEFSYLVESLQQYPLSDKEREEIAKEIKELDKLFSLMSKEEVFFVLKSEIYKELLNKPRLAQQSQYYNKKILRTLLDLIEAKIDSYHPFAKWIIIATYADLKQIFDSPYYNTFVVEKKGIGLKNPNAALIEKKLNLVLPWFEDITGQSPEVFHENLKPVMLSLLAKLNKKIKYLLQYSRFEKLNLVTEDALKYFEIKSPEEKAAKKDPLLDMDLPTEKPTEVAKDQWMPKNGPLEPDPNYVAPEKLPTPTDDW
ncbi:MAG: hypothetical protein ACHQYQ_00095 [Bacteriovoracales bacterium]